MKLFHSKTGGDENPICVGRTDDGLELFMFDGNTLARIESLNVEVPEAANNLVPVDNDNGTISIKFGDKFLSARQDGSFSLEPNNSDQERFTPTPIDFIDVSAENVFAVRTFHKTKLTLDAALNIRHRAKLAENELPIYARLSDKRISFFVFKDNALKYLGAIDKNGTTILSDEPIEFNAVSNPADHSITIGQNDQFWSARKETGAFVLVPRNQEWEHLTLEKINALEVGKRRVIIFPLESNALDAALERLKRERIDLRAILTNETLDPKRNLPAVSLELLNRVLINGRNALWLLTGGSADERRNMSEYLQQRGLRRDRIVDFDRKMRVEPFLLSKVKSAAETECEFVATGGLDMAREFDAARLLGQRGFNLAAEDQDLRQSYLISKYVLERNRSIKFALIELTADTLSIEEEEPFAPLGLECRYIFAGEPRHLEEKIFTRPFDLEIKFPTEEAESEAAPLPPEKKSFPIAKKSATICERKLRQLEAYVQLCVEHNVKPVGVIFPSNDPNDERIKILRRILAWFEKIYGFVLIESTTSLRNKGALPVSSEIDFRLRARGILPFEDMRLMNYERLTGLREFLSKDEYTSTMSRLFALSIEKIKSKEKIKVGFVLYDASMWAGDELYHQFANDDRYEPTIFLCLRMDVRSDVLTEAYRKELEIFKSKGVKVVGVSRHNAAIPKQDVLINLTPYFGCLPRPFRMRGLTAETLITYIPYGLGTSEWEIKIFRIYHFLWKIFVCSKDYYNRMIDVIKLDASRVVNSGHPKMDSIVSDNPTSSFEWKTAQPDAKKIIWAPHWAIKEGVRFATFQWNFKFFYEYAKNHPETSWVVKPHPNLLFSAVKAGLFPSEQAFKDYLDAWDALPNAQVVLGGYYQSIFATSDAMILDSSSFVIEYQYAQKPMLFLTRATTKLNRLGKAIVDANYHVEGKNHAGIAKFIEDVVINGSDPQREAREKIFDEELNYKKDNGMLASEMIFETIDRALTDERDG